MSIHDTHIADVYIDGGKTGALRGILPSDVIDFRGGHTKVRNPDVLAALLRREDMEIHPTTRYNDSWTEWIAACPYNHPPRARIVLSNGYVLSPDNGYRIETPIPLVEYGETFGFDWSSAADGEGNPFPAGESDDSTGEPDEEPDGSGEAPPEQTPAVRGRKRKNVQPTGVAGVPELPPP